MSMSTSTASIYITAQDKTKNALNSITNNLKGLGGVIAGVVATAGGLALINQSLEKYASLNDFSNFDIGADKALQYVDTLKLAGMEMGNVQKTFEDLSVKVAEGINNEELAKTFSKLGVDAKALKNENIDVIFDKIRDSLSQMTDKTEALALAKEVFGKNGIAILDSSQDEELKRVEAVIESMKYEVRAASMNADELYKNFDRIGALIENEVSNAFAAVLTPVNALLNTIIEAGTEVDKVKSQADILASADSWASLIEWGFDFGSVLYNIVYKAIEAITGAVDFLRGNFMGLIAVIELVGKSIYYGITEAFVGAQRAATDIFEAMALAVKGNFEDAGQALKRAVTPGEGLARYVSEVTKPLEKISIEAERARQGMGKIFSFTPQMGFNEEKEKFMANYRKFREQLAQAMAAEDNKKGNKPPRKGVGKTNSDIGAGIADAMKDLERIIAQGQTDLDILNKYNQLAYDNNLKTLEAYYAEKEDLDRKSYELNSGLLKEQLELLEISASLLPKGSKERNKLEDQYLDIKNKQHKQEEEYGFLMAENNQKKVKERYEFAQKELSARKELLSIEEERLNFDVSRGAKDSFEANLKVVDIRKQMLSSMKEEINLLENKTNKTRDEEVALAKAKLAYEKFADEIDPIATEINKSIGGAFEGFFNDVFSGTKSIKDAFKDMFADINSMILQMIAKNLGNQLMKSLMGDGGNSSGGAGGFLSSLFGSGSGGGDFFSSLISGFFATGGYAQAGNAYVVGEKGPELFFPGQSGYVANNGDSARMAGGGSPINVHFHGITDIQSFKQSETQIAQRLMGAVQRGQRNS